MFDIHFVGNSTPDRSLAVKYLFLVYNIIILLGIFKLHYMRVGLINLLLFFF